LRAERLYDDQVRQNYRYHHHVKLYINGEWLFIVKRAGEVQEYDKLYCEQDDRKWRILFFACHLAMKRKIFTENMRINYLVFSLFSFRFIKLQSEIFLCETGTHCTVHIVFKASLNTESFN
jgi:hypothetical protein